MIVSALELKKMAKSDVIVSHYFVYWLHWYLDNE